MPDTPTDEEMIVYEALSQISRFSKEKFARDHASRALARLERLATPGDYDAAMLRMNREAAQTLGEQVVGLTEQLRTLSDAAREVASCPIGIIMSDAKYERLRRALERLDAVLDALSKPDPAQ